MPVIYDVDTARNLIRFSVSGQLVVDEVIETVSKAMRLIDRSQPFFDLWDMSAMTELDGQAEDIERLARRWAMAGPIRRPPGKTALVATSPYQYGVARMYMSWLGEQPHWESQLFRSMEEAWTWLNTD